MPFNSETAVIAGKMQKRGPSQRTKILNELFDPGKAKQIFGKLEEKALNGELEPIRLYLAYCFGKPESKIDIVTDGQPLVSDSLARLTSHQLMALKEIKEAIEQN